MDKATRKKIQKIIDGMSCPKNFKCADNPVENLCRAKDLGLKSYLDCLEGRPSACPFAEPFGFGYFCKCPLRVFLSKELGK